MTSKKNQTYDSVPNKVRRKGKFNKVQYWKRNDNYEDEDGVQGNRDKSDYMKKDKDKDKGLDPGIEQAIKNSKIYINLSKQYSQTKKRNEQQKKQYEQQIQKKRKQKQLAQQQHNQLCKQVDRYNKLILSMRNQIHQMKDINDQYSISLADQIFGEDQYVSNLMMAMQYDHNVNPDRMTYEQLLQLQQKIGVVNRGLPKQLIKKLPKARVKKATKDKCTVCFSEFELGQIITRMNCKHQFHFTCIQSWLQKQKHCPLCKTQVQFKKK